MTRGSLPLEGSGESSQALRSHVPRRVLGLPRPTLQRAGLHTPQPTIPTLAGCHVDGTVAVIELRAAATAAWQQPGVTKLTALAAAPPDATWATAVIGCSSEYDDSLWSAKQLLGPPTVFPAYGDINGVWAAASVEGSTMEYVELEFGGPMYVRGLEVYETYRPGAVVRVALRNVTAGGIRTHAETAARPWPCGSGLVPLCSCSAAAKTRPQGARVSAAHCVVETFRHPAGNRRVARGTRCGAVTPSKPTCRPRRGSSHLGCSHGPSLPPLFDSN